MADFGDDIELFIYLGCKEIEENKKLVFFSHVQKKQETDVKEVTGQIMNVLISQKKYELNQIVIVFSVLTNKVVLITIISHVYGAKFDDPYAIPKKAYIEYWINAFNDSGKRSEELIFAWNGTYFSIYGNPNKEIDLIPYSIPIDTHIDRVFEIQYILTKKPLE